MDQSNRVLLEGGGHRAEGTRPIREEQEFGVRWMRKKALRPAAWSVEMRTGSRLQSPPLRLGLGKAEPKKTLKRTPRRPQSVGSRRIRLESPGPPRPFRSTRQEMYLAQFLQLRDPYSKRDVGVPAVGENLSRAGEVVERRRFPQPGAARLLGERRQESVTTGRGDHFTVVLRDPFTVGRF